MSDKPNVIGRGAHPVWQGEEGSGAVCESTVKEKEVTWATEEPEVVENSIWPVPVKDPNTVRS